MALGVLALTGCGGGSSNSSPGPWASAALSLYSGSNKPVVALQPVEGFATCTVRGRATLRGARLNFQNLEAQLARQIAAHPDGEACVLAGGKGELPRTAWQIGPDGGVANVFVWLQPEAGTFFKIDPDRKPWPDEVVLDSPACALKPRACVLFPSYPNPLLPQQQIETRQLVVVRNNSRFSHSIKWGDGGLNPGENRALAPGGNFALTVKPSREPIRFACAVHPWMVAYARAFDHPFAAVTGPDGRYEIKGVPRDVFVRLVAWHEAAGYVTGDAKGIPMNFGGEMNERDLSVEAR
jgi:hypothetical protein